MSVIIFDTETTGLNEPAIVEAAYLVVEGLRPVHVTDHFCERFNPGKPIEFGAMATHFITNTDVAASRPECEFEIPAGVQYIIGHNVDFDCGVIGNADAKRICTLAMARHLFPKLDSHEQSAVMLYLFGEGVVDLIKNAHSAFHDVMMCKDILNFMISQCMPEVQSWEDVYQFSENARIPTVMTFGKHKGTPIADVPADYVQWLSRQPDVDPYLMKAFRSR